jgi:hypothetical protein
MQKGVCPLTAAAEVGAVAAVFMFCVSSTVTVVHAKDLG